VLGYCLIADFYHGFLLGADWIADFLNTCFSVSSFNAGGYFEKKKLLTQCAGYFFSFALCITFNILQKIFFTFSCLQSASNELKFKCEVFTYETYVIFIVIVIYLFLAAVVHRETGTGTSNDVSTRMHGP
jgi:hypothetical protein